MAGKEVFPLEAGIDVAGAAALRQITGDVLKIALFLALRADLRRLGRFHGVAALGALPMGLHFHAAHLNVLLGGEGF
jgi:hypothetical protein